MPQRLALLVGANPRVSISGPKVRLYAGDWKVQVRGLEDTTLILERSTENMIVGNVLNKEKFEEIVEGNCDLQIHIGKRGKESSIDVTAEFIEHGNDPTTIQG